MGKANTFGIAPFDAAEYLKDEKSIAAFLNASRAMNDPAVLLNALSTVARARGMSDLAEASGLGRESLYKALRPGAQPRYDTVMRVMDALGVEMVFQAKHASAGGRQSTGKTVSRAPRKRSAPVSRAVVSRKAPSRSRSPEVRANAKAKEALKSR